MALPMSRPTKHPKTGIYLLRKRVPDELRSLLGKGEVKQSLGTRDPAEAKRLYAQALVDLDQQWANLRKGPQLISEREAHALAHPIEVWFVATHEGRPSQQALWDVEVGATLWQRSSEALDLTLSSVELLTQPADKNKFRRAEMRAWCEAEASSCLSSRGLATDEEGRVNLVKAISQAMQRAALTLKRYAEGEYIPQARQPFASQAVSSITQGQTAELKFEAVFKEWVAERKPAEKTQYVYKAVLKQLQGFVGHDDAYRLTPEDLVNWETGTNWC